MLTVCRIVVDTDNIDKAYKWIFENRLTFYKKSQSLSGNKTMFSFGSTDNCLHTKKIDYNGLSITYGVG